MEREREKGGDCEEENSGEGERVRDNKVDTVTKEEKKDKNREKGGDNVFLNYLKNVLMTL